MSSHTVGAKVIPLKDINTKKATSRISKPVASVLVIGAGVAGMQAALDTADKGYKVAIIDKTSTIGGSMVKLDKTFPTNDCSICTAAPKNGRTSSASKY